MKVHRKKTLFLLLTLFAITLLSNNLYASPLNYGGVDSVNDFSSPSATGTLTVTGTQVTDTGCQSTSVTITGTVTGTVNDGNGYDSVLFELWDDGVMKDSKTIRVAVGTTENVSVTLSFNSLYGTSAPGVGVYVRELSFRQDPFYPTNVTGTCSGNNRLNVSKTGTGSGTVTSSPSGINCGSTCSALFSANSQVTITASAASNSTFAGWSGDCSGTTTTCTVTMNSAKNVTATFNTSTTPGPCTYTITATPTSFGASGGAGNVTVTPSSPNCNAEWYINSDSSWLQFTYSCPTGTCTRSSANGIGAGVAGFVVAANGGAQQRIGNLTLVGGNTVTITQSAATTCTYTISASPTSFGATGGTGIITVTPSMPTCNAEWYLNSDSSWINFTYTCGSGICTSSTTSGVGAGTATFKVDANSSQQQRVGNIALVGGNSLAITQAAGSSCTECGLNFTDATTSWAYQNILAIGCAGITQGCAPSLYCPANYVTRAQMAAFIVRAREGEPPADYCASGSGFNDILTSDGFCKYIKRLGELQITQGCGNNNYCPSDYVTRGQMAAFIIRSLYGENFTYTLTPYFTDVPTTHNFFKYVQKMKDVGLTTQTGTYDVDGYVTREMMAAFLYRAYLKDRCESTTCNDASVTVRVMNAINGAAINGAIVVAGGQTGTTDTSGNVTISGLTASTGSSSQNTVTVQVSKTGYVSQNARVNLVCGQTVTVSVSLLPEDTGTTRGDVRIVLTWGENPRDLDSHLSGPKTNSTTTRFHVYFGAKNNCSSNPCDATIPAWLDVDDTTSYGPETITIKSTNGVLTPGMYRYSIHHYAGTSNIPQSGAVVKVYQGSNLVGTYTPPQPASGQTVTSGWVWTVFEMDVNSSGAVTFRNIGTYSAPGSITYSIPYEKNEEDSKLFMNLKVK